MMEFPSSSTPSSTLLASRESVFLGTVLSTVCMISAAVLLPMAHMHNQQRIGAMLAEVELCRMGTRDIWRQMPASVGFTSAKYPAEEGREKREAGGNNPYSRYSAIMSASLGACCSCSQGMEWICL